MHSNERRFAVVDVLYILIMVVPILTGIVWKVITNPLRDGVSITGARILFTIPMPIQELPITESQINSWLVVISVLGLCLFLTHELKVRADTKRQHVVEWLVLKAEDLVRGNMGEYFMGFTPFIVAILALSALSSLLSLFGLYPPTSDLNVTAGWALLVFILITYYKMKCGPVHYLKSFARPVPLLAPMNVLSEVATPLSMAFRHYGNILSGTVIAALVSTGLRGLTRLLLGWLPGFLGEIPYLQIGIPAVLSIYFDLFSGCLQAYIFAMLTMMYVSGGFLADLYFEKKKQKEDQRYINKTLERVEHV